MTRIGVFGVLEPTQQPLSWAFGFKRMIKGMWERLLFGIVLPSFLSPRQFPASPSRQSGSGKEDVSRSLALLDGRHDYGKIPRVSLSANGSLTSRGATGISGYALDAGGNRKRESAGHFRFRI